MNVKVRIAPSPTGNLHIGTVRTALFNWLFARKQGGTFILRVEDTDLERSDKKYEENIIEGLKWLGIDWAGEIYRQTERLSLYRENIERLLTEGKAFWCHHTLAELDIERKAQSAAKQPPRHECEHKHSEKGKQEGEVIRLTVGGAPRTLTFKDSIRGDISWETSLLGDISLAKDLNTPLYNLAVVVDDIDLKISHVIRGEEHISNTPKQLLIYEALGEKPPEFAHLPLILNPDKTKLSKRAGATSVDDYKRDYLPDALVNFIGFLGYTYSKEIVTKEEMAKEFELEKVHKSGAIFDIKKLNWINSQYVKKLSSSELNGVLGVQLPESARAMVTERLEKLSDVEAFSFFWKSPEYDSELLPWKNVSVEATMQALHRAKEIFETSDMHEDIIRKELDAVSVGNRGQVYWPLRVALSGQKASPDPVDIALVIGKQETLKRIDTALAKLS